MIQILRNSDKERIELMLRNGKLKLPKATSKPLRISKQIT